MHSIDYMHFGNSTDRLWDWAKVEVVKINQTKIICPSWPDGSSEEKHDFSWTAALTRQRTMFSTFLKEKILDSMWFFPSKANFLNDLPVSHPQNAHEHTHYSILFFLFPYCHYVLINPFSPHCGLSCSETGFKPTCPGPPAHMLCVYGNQL